MTKAIRQVLPLQASVIICTYSPRRQTIARALDALQEQSELVSKWELIVVDNNSDPPVSDWLDLSWHPHGRIGQERQLGLTYVRMKGISEARSSLITFVDDDNLLSPAYISEAIRIGEQHGFLGAWGGEGLRRIRDATAPVADVIPVLYRGEGMQRSGLV